MRWIRSALIAAAMPIAGAIPAVAQAEWSVLKTMHIGGEGGWDYLTVDGQNHRLFVTRTSHTQVIDSDSGKVLGDIPGQINAHGVALVPSLNRGFITDGGGDGSIVIFDLKTYAVVGKLATMPDSDGIVYDATLGRILAVSGDKGALITFKADIDPRRERIETPIQLDGAPEFLASDGKGKVYVNLEDKDVVAVVDLNERKVVNRWPVAPGGHPVGISLDKKTRRLYVGCRNPQRLVVMSADDGEVLGAVPIGAGVDATQVDGGQAFASCRDGSLVVGAEKDGSYAVAQTVKTPQGARTMGLDMLHHTLYLPTAEMLPGPSGQRPRAKPDSFMIVVVGRK